MYQLRLSAGAETVTQSLRVDLDPRVRVADTTLTAQLRLAQDIASALADEWALADSLHAARVALKDAAGRVRDRQTLDSLRAAVDGAGASLARLMGVVESADREPTAQARQAYLEARATLTQGWQRCRARSFCRGTRAAR